MPALAKSPIESPLRPEKVNRYIILEQPIAKTPKNDVKTCEAREECPVDLQHIVMQRALNDGQCGIRTHDLWLRRPALYPAELIAPNDPNR